ncbi:MAG: hypothetical protein R8G66_14385 [Cytophagales bacterium]|nr:hypothetical protein [Cytophagales bacterium]
MIVFYALGGGWGHFTRVHSFIQQAGFDVPKKVIVANPKAATYFDTDELIVVPELAQKDAVALRSFLLEISRSNDIEKWYIDTFPVGILGELEVGIFQGAEVNLLARRLIWENYLPMIQAPIQFTNVYRFESLEAEYQEYLDKHSRAITSVDFSASSFAEENRHPLGQSEQPIWLVVHSSSEEELALLIDHAFDLAFIEKKRPRIIVLSDFEASVPKGSHLLLGENPRDWYGLAERIFTAAGFNTWYELAHYREKHICLPFKRKYDDQFWRSRQG